MRDSRADAGFIDRRIGVILLLVGVSGGLLAVWKIQATHMAGNFAETVRSGQLDGLPIDLRGKTWTEEEIATVEVIKLDDSWGRERSIERSIHMRDAMASRAQYAYQAVMTDLDTGIRHVFGYSRRSPQRWLHVTIHRDSMEQHIQRRMQQQQEGYEIPPVQGREVTP